MTSYERKLDQLLDQIFQSISEELTYQEIAAKSGLSVSTVWNIDKRVTRLPRLKTVFALARVGGLDLQLVAKRVGVRVA